MKLSIFTTLTNPEQRGDTWFEAEKCYQEMADEVVLVHGTTNYVTYYHDWSDNMHSIHYEWPKEFKWPFIGQQFQRGYEACTGDWVIHMDLDFIIHENDFEALRQNLEVYNDEPAFSMLKRQFILPDRFNLKSRLVVAVNKGKFGDRIKFNSGGDLCQPSLDGQYIQPGTVPDVKIPIWNYEKIKKTKEQIADDAGRMERAYKRHFGVTQYKSDGTDENAYEKWYKAQKGKFAKPQERVPLEDHPKYMQETIKNLRPERFGYSGFGLIEGRVYG